MPERVEWINHVPGADQVIHRAARMVHPTETTATIFGWRPRTTALARHKEGHHD
jgi:hypothetical protein